MFGTLQCTVPQRPELEFKTNAEPQWVRGIGRRDKPRFSCDWCKKRRIRCDGKADRCSACIRASQECHYATSPRRKRSAESSEEGRGRVNDANVYRHSLGNKPPMPLPQNDWDNCPRPTTANPTIEKSARAEVESLEMSAWSQISGVEAPAAVPTELDEDNMSKSRALRSSSYHVAYPQHSVERPMVNSNWEDTFVGASSIGLNDFGSPMSFSKLFGTPSAFSAEQNLPLTNIVSASNLSLHKPEGNPNLEVQIPSPERKSPPSGSDGLSVARSGTSKTSLQSSDGVRSSCSCLQLTACLIEELGQKSSSSTPKPSIDILLSYLKKAHRHCSQSLDCSTCNTLSENDLLLTMCGRYMATLCERIVTSYITLMLNVDRKHDTATLGAGRMASGTHQHESQRPAKMQRPDEPEDETEREYAMSFGSYQIESCYEQKQVLRCIVTVQLQEFRELIEKLKTRAGNRIAHLTLVDEAERRMQTVRSMLSSQLPSLS